MGQVAFEVISSVVPIGHARHLRHLKHVNKLDDAARVARGTATTVERAAVRSADAIATIQRGGVHSYASGEAQVDLAERVFVRYQRYIDEAYAAGLKAQAAGRLKPPPGIAAETRLGQYVDRASLARLRRWLASDGIAEGPGQAIQLNRYLRDPLGSGAYRIPDIRLPGSNIIFDGTIGMKTATSPQVVNFRLFSGGNNVTIVRPTQLGGSYSLVF